MTSIKVKNQNEVTPNHLSATYEVEEVGVESSKYFSLQHEVLKEK